MTHTNGSQIATVAHLFSAVQYWASCALSVACFQFKALLEILVNGQSADWLAGLE